MYLCLLGIWRVPSSPNGPTCQWTLALPSRHPAASGFQLWRYRCNSAILPKRGVPQSPAIYRLTRQEYDSSFSKVLLGITGWPWHSTRHAANHQWKHAQTHSYFLPVALNANSHDLHFMEKTRGIPSGFYRPEIRRRCWAVSCREEVKYCF